MEKKLVILGSARNESNTQKAIQKFFPDNDYLFIDLRAHNIGSYDYDHSQNQGDDFLVIAQKMAAADVIIFATPVYWYSMSALMKIFFDRFSELLTTHKSVGRSLKGKKVFLVSTGSDSRLPTGFETPFQMTAAYFDMSYQRAFYASTAEIQ